jgi:hypothetical protein
MRYHERRREEVGGEQEEIKECLQFQHQAKEPITQISLSRKTQQSMNERTHTFEALFFLCFLFLCFIFSLSLPLPPYEICVEFLDKCL